LGVWENLDQLVRDRGERGVGLDVLDATVIPTDLACYMAKVRSTGTQSPL
jgi:hypothetical protein